MKLLVMDTSQKTCSVAVLDGEKPLAERTIDEGLTHSETLMPLIDAVLNKAGIAAKELGGVAAVTGPGSFTGVRIGVAAAMGFSQALDIPVYSLNALELLAEGAGAFDGVIIPMIDARRGNVYAAAFENGKRLTEDKAISAAEAAAMFKDRPVLFVGDGAVNLKEEILAVRTDAVFSAENFPRAKNAARLLPHTPATDAKGIFAEYLRPSRAERKL